MKNLIAKFFVFLFLVLIAQGIFVQKRSYLAPNNQTHHMLTENEARYDARTDDADFLANNKNLVSIAKETMGSLKFAFEINVLIANGLGGTGSKLAAENAGWAA